MIGSTPDNLPAEMMMDTNESTLSASVILSVAMALLVGLGGLFFLLRSDDTTESIEEISIPQEVVDMVEVESIEEFEILEREEVEALAKEEAPPESIRISEDPFDSFRDAYRQHYDQNSRRLLHVTIDRPLYRPGQPIHFQSWHLSPGDLQGDGADGEEISVELLSPRGDVVEKQDLTLRLGMVSGIFEMDEEAPGGNWRLRVKDGDRNYSRPVLVSYFEAPRFRKEVDFEEPAYRPGDEVTAEIEILRDTGDAPRGLNIEGYVQVAGAHVEDITAELDFRGKAEITFTLPDTIDADEASLILSVDEGGMVETGVWPIPLALDDLLLEFKPEGGELVWGLPSRVYFEATDLSGKPVEFTGKVLNSQGQMVARAETTHKGRGRFEFTPEEGEIYGMVVEDRQMSTSFELPEPSDEGCTMRVYDDFDSLDDAVRVGVWCTENKIIGIMGAMGNRLLDVTRMVASSETPAVAYLRPQDEETWPRKAGVVRVTVVEDDSDIKPIADRVVFRGRRAQMDIELSFDRTVYHPGESAEITVETRGLAGESLSAELVRSMVDDRVYAQSADKTPSILGRLLLGADDLHFWADDIEEADEYFDLYEDTAAELDLLMGVRGWRASEKLEKYYVDGGKVQLPPAPVIRRRVRRPPTRPQPRPRRKRFFDMSQRGGGGGGIGRAPMAAGLGGGGGGGSGGISTHQAPSRASAEEFYFDEIADSESSPDEDGAFGAIEPQYMRDDDAVAFSGWSADLQTDDSGRTYFTIPLPEAIGAYRLAIEGVSTTGLVGRTQEVLRIATPLSIVTRLPEILSGGDYVQLPVTLRNTTSEPMSVTTRIETEGPITVMEIHSTLEMEVPPQSTLTRYIPLQVYDSREEANVRVIAEGGGFTDGAERTVSVMPRGFQRDWHVSGQLPGNHTHDVPLQGMTDAGAIADIILYPGAVSEALEGVESMAQRPTGCFEQTSSRNHPNLLVWQYLKANDQLDAEFEASLMGHIESGYSRMLTFEIDGGGFEWFGRGPAQAHLTAWGLVQFSMIQEIVDHFDPTVMDRSVAFLHTLKDDQGGWATGRDASWARMTSEQRESAELFVLYGLARANRTEGFQAHFERAAAIGRDSDEVYKVALAAAALAYSGHHSDDVEAIMQRLATMQNGDGSWSPSQGRSWAGGYGGAFNAETTGLAALALIKGGGSRQSIQKGIDWLGENKTGAGWWGTTIATVMALEARIAYEEAGLDDNSGDVYVEVDGERVGQVFVENGEQQPLRIDGIGAHLSSSNTQIRVRSEVALDYDIEVSWRQEEFDIDGESPLEYSVSVGDDEPAQMGDALQIEVILSNREDQALGMTIARVALPAGVEVAPRELDALVERSPVSFYETSGREIIFYFDDLAAEQTHTLNLMATAAVPGIFEVPASVAFPYYRTESSWQWTERGEFVVAAPR